MGRQSTDMWQGYVDYPSPVEDAADLARRRAEFIARAIPQEYRRAIDRTLLKNPVAFDNVQAWTASGDRPGLVAYGDARRGKTRAVYSRLAEIHKTDGREFIAITANDLKAAILAMSKQGTSGAAIGGRLGGVESIAELREEFRAVDVLFIDDLGKEKLTPCYAEELFSLVEARFSEGKPIAFTVQMGGSELVRRMRGYDSAYSDFADGIYGRMKDFCIEASFGSNSETP